MFLYYAFLFTITLGLPLLVMVSTRSSANGAANLKANAQLNRAANGHLSKADASIVDQAAFLPGKGRVWSHTPSNLTLLWLAISLPLVTWDIGYVLLRPHSMPGGKYHWPLWVPYELYGRVDYIYGWKAWNEHNGFTAAQTRLNVVETLMYVFYAYIVYTAGRQSVKQGRGAPTDGGKLSESRTVRGQAAGLAVLVGYTASIMTVSKTVMYCKFGHPWLEIIADSNLGLNEYHSGFDNIGHNTLSNLIILWVIPKHVSIHSPMHRECL